MAMYRERTPASRLVVLLTLDWSYNLLTEPEQLLLNRLAVFAGGWSLEAAEVVCADEGIAQADALDLLAQLVSISLMMANKGGDGAERYRLLEPFVNTGGRGCWQPAKRKPRTNAMRLIS